MSDYIVRATAADANIRAFAVTAKEMVETAREHHKTTPVMTAALGRLLCGGQLRGRAGDERGARGGPQHDEAVRRRDGGCAPLRAHRQQLAAVRVDCEHAAGGDAGHRHAVGEGVVVLGGGDDRHLRAVSQCRQEPCGLRGPHLQPERGRHDGRSSAV